MCGIQLQGLCPHTGHMAHPSIGRILFPQLLQTGSSDALAGWDVTNSTFDVGFIIYHLLFRFLGFCLCS